MSPLVLRPLAIYHRRTDLQVFNPLLTLLHLFVLGLYLCLQLRHPRRMLLLQFRMQLFQALELLAGLLLQEFA